MLSPRCQCTGAGIAGALFGLSASVYAQTPDMLPPTSDPLLDALLRLASGSPLALVIGLIAWMARGAMANGIPIQFQLQPVDREALLKAADAVRAIERLDERVDALHNEVIRLRDRAHEQATELQAVKLAVTSLRPPPRE